MQKRKINILSPVFCLCFLLSVSFLQAQSDQSFRQKNFNLKNNLAIEGYDPVAYFTQNKAVKGSKNFNYNYKGVIYNFAHQQNLNTFKANPDKYEPQFGGWCAYAFGAKGEKVSINPETFKIIDGKLYLFYNAWGTNTLNLWNKDENNLKKKAEENWKKNH